MFLCGVSKGFVKALKAFIKPFEAPVQKQKFKLIFILIQLSEMHEGEKVNRCYTTYNVRQRFT